jgi:hypothetical protein
VRYYKPKTCEQCGYQNRVTRYFCEKCSAELPPDQPEPAKSVWRRKGPYYGMLALLGLVLTVFIVENEIVAFKGDHIEISLRGNAPPPPPMQDSAMQAEVEQPETRPGQPPTPAITPFSDAPENLSRTHTTVMTSPLPEPPEPDPVYVRPENSRTLFPIDREWSNVGGWFVYFNREISACLAEAKQADGTIFLLGLKGPDNDLIVGFSNSQPPYAADTLDFRFEPERLYNPAVGYLEGARLMVGNYGKGDQLRDSIARLLRLSIADGDNAVAEISLRGTNATLTKLEECQREFGDSGNAAASVQFSVLDEIRCVNKPDSGSILETTVEFGEGGHKLIARNGTKYNAIVIVEQASDGQFAFSFLVERGQAETITGVPDGNYQVHYRSGVEFDETCQEFQQVRTRQTKEILPWNTEITGERIITISNDSPRPADPTVDKPLEGEPAEGAPPPDETPAEAESGGHASSDRTSDNSNADGSQASNPVQ